MIERVLLFILFATWVISLIGTFAFGVTMDKYKSLEKYAVGCGATAFITALIIVSSWW